MRLLTYDDFLIFFAGARRFAPGPAKKSLSYHVTF